MVFSVATSIYFLGNVVLLSSGQSQNPVSDISVLSIDVILWPVDATVWSADAIVWSTDV